MKVQLITVAGKVPQWVDSGAEDYARRLGRDLQFAVVDIPMVRRGKRPDIDQCVKKEADAILARIPADDYVVALEVTGKTLATTDLAEEIRRIRDQGRNLSLMAGGPDGLHESCRQRADALWSLSGLTLPHALVRVLVAEQVYRVWSLFSGHPYHRS